jgi:hypothetical protein
MNGQTDHNQTGIDPLLDALGDYGGPTQTHLPKTGSPVIDKANPAGCRDAVYVTLLVDQRGFPRHVDGDGVAVKRCDIGAVEFALNPPPAITSLNPASAQEGGPAFTLTVTGNNFVAGSIVRWDGANRTTTYVSETQLSALINATDITTQGSAVVTVFNPEPGGGVSNELTFTITPPPPEIEKIYLPIVVR